MSYFYIILLVPIGASRSVRCIFKVQTTHQVSDDTSRRQTSEPKSSASRHPHKPRKDLSNSTLRNLTFYHNRSTIRWCIQPISFLRRFSHSPPQPLDPCQRYSICRRHSRVALGSLDCMRMCRSRYSGVCTNPRDTCTDTAPRTSCPGKRMHLYHRTCHDPNTLGRQSFHQRLHDIWILGTWSCHAQHGQRDSPPQCQQDTNVRSRFPANREVHTCYQFHFLESNKEKEPTAVPKGQTHFGSSSPSSGMTHSPLPPQGVPMSSVGHSDCETANIAPPACGNVTKRK